MARHKQPSPPLHAVIYPDDVAKLLKLRIDILMTHEALACNRHGFAAPDELARSMRAVRSFHGHHHDDQSTECMLGIEQRGYDPRAADYFGIKNRLGQVVRVGG